MKIINIIREQVKEFVILIGIGLGFGFSIILFYTFMVAYTNGDYQVLVNINTFGEAKWEIILVPIIMVWIIIASIFYIKSISASKRQVSYGKSLRG